MPSRETAHHVLVLIADDERSIAAVVADIVEDLDFRPLVAGDGRDALALARATWPALVITDLMMPGFTGIDLMDALRSEAAALGRVPIPVIIMTAAGVANAKRAGADAVLSKPFDVTELEGLVMRFLPRSGLPSDQGDTSLQH